MLINRTAILAKNETTYGTDATPAASDAIDVFDFTIKPTGDKIVRQPYKANLSPSEHVIGKKLVEGSFKMEVRGAGAAYSASVRPDPDPILRASGLSATVDTTPGAEKVTYDPVSTGFESVTIYAYMDGLIHKVLGCFCTFKLIAQAGQIAIFEVSFKGLYQVPVDGAIITPTLLALQPPIVQSVGLTIGGWAAGVYEKLEMDAAVEISERPDLNSAEGLKGLAITGRQPAGSMDPLAVTEATKSFWANWKAGTAEALTATIGSTQYNKMTLSAPKVQISDIAWGDRSKERIYSLGLNFAGNAGDDEFQLVFA